VSGPAVPRLAGMKKLLAFASTTVCATILQLQGQFDATIATFLGGVFAAYVSGNVGEHFASARAARIALPPLPVRPNGARPAPAPPPAEVTAPKHTPAVHAALAAGIDLGALRRELSSLDGGH
jgi:hypothetical protein